MTVCVCEREKGEDKGTKRYDMIITSDDVNAVCMRQSFDYEDPPRPRILPPFAGSSLQNKQQLELQERRCS